MAGLQAHRGPQESQRRDLNLEKWGRKNADSEREPPTAIYYHRLCHPSLCLQPSSVLQKQCAQVHLLLKKFNWVSFHKKFNWVFFFVRAFSVKRTKLFLLNLLKDDRPRKGEPKDICALASNKILPSSSEFKETKKSKKPGIRGDDETFQVASTSRAPLEAELFKPPSADLAGNRFDFKNSKSCQNISAVGNNSTITASFDQIDLPPSQNGHFKQSHFCSFSFQDGSLDSDSSAMPDISCWLNDWMFNSFEILHLEWCQLKLVCLKQASG